MSTVDAAASSPQPIYALLSELVRETGLPRESITAFNRAHPERFPRAIVRGNRQYVKRAEFFAFLESVSTEIKPELPVHLRPSVDAKRKPEGSKRKPIAYAKAA